MFEHVLDHHPFDVVGWDGFEYPFAFNIKEFAPKAGKIHLPPPIHLVFTTPHFVVRFLSGKVGKMYLPSRHIHLFPLHRWMPLSFQAEAREEFRPGKGD